MRFVFPENAPVEMDVASVVTLVVADAGAASSSWVPVSYTHLTLPTIAIV